MVNAAVIDHTGPASAVQLNNGQRLPVIGLGVYKATGDECRTAVLSALKIGYRHIDTAQFYQNETEVGQAVRSSGIPREQVWVTSKIMPDMWSDPATAFERSKTAIQQSADRLDLGYIDLLLLHAPGSPEGRAQAWRAAEEAQHKGIVRSIGVSNFGIGHLDKLAVTATITPAVNQIELHPWLQRHELVEYCKIKGIVLEAYSPLARPYMKSEGGVEVKLDDPRLGQLAKKVDKSPAQVLLRWSLQRGFVPLPKSSNPDRQAANIDVFDWSLTDDDMSTLDGFEEDFVTIAHWDPIRQHEV